MTLSALTELEATLAAMPADQKAALDKTIAAELAMPWRPNPGPQALAFFSQADETFYGGQAGGGKTHLAIGLALTTHKRSLILRRINKDVMKIVPHVEELLGHRNGFNGQSQHWRLGEKLIEFSGCEMEADKQRFKGDPHDLIVFDEGTDFLESQYRFIIGWNRSADPKQRCRVLVTSNPPTTADGLWVIQYWAPWLDDGHPKPAKPGELRWFTTIDGRDVEVDGPGPHIIPGEPEPVRARSRTFIPAALNDNPDLAETGYASVLAAMPGVLRDAYRDGKFSAVLRDSERQVIPTAWLRAAQARWTPQPPLGAEMSAIAADVAQGGADEFATSARYDSWFAPLVVVPGELTETPSKGMAIIVQNRRHNAICIVDKGGGYGGGIIERLKEQEALPNYAASRIVGFDGASAPRGATKDAAKLPFYNRRSEALWRFREALDPDQEHGSQVALPPDPALIADLSAPTFEMKNGKILVEGKDSIKKRLGRSTNRGDAAMMCWSEGNHHLERGVIAAHRFHAGSGQPTVRVGYAGAKRYGSR